MPKTLLWFLIVAFALRLAWLAHSIRNERALKRAGAIEHGARTSAMLALVHPAFYVAAPIEGALRGWPFGAVSGLGMLIYAFGIAWLAIVTTLLGRLWTVKLIIARDHRLVTHPVFRLVRHPNYYLAILPELVGYATAFQAWATLVIGLAIYAVPLGLRIRQEEAAMRDRFPEYGS